MAKPADCKSATVGSNPTGASDLASFLPLSGSPFMLTLPGPAVHGLERKYSPLLYRLIRSKGGGGYNKILKKLCFSMRRIELGFLLTKGVVG